MSPMVPGMSWWCKQFNRSVLNARVTSAVLGNMLLPGRVQVAVPGATPEETKMGEEVARDKP